MNFIGKTAVVSGGASGIGKAIASALQAAGAKVASLDLREGTADLNLICDMGSDGSVAKACAEIRQDLGGPDILVHCAATTFIGPVSETPMRDCQRIMNINLYGALRLTRAFIDAMKARKSGVILYISSINAEFATPGQGVYAASKAALDSLVKTMAVELADDGIRINSIRPSSVATPLLVNAFNAMPNAAEAIAANKARHPLNRWGQPDEVAKLALFLVSEDAAWVTGAHYALDGGASVTRQ